jgi:hypothetical protein
MTRRAHHVGDIMIQPATSTVRGRQARRKAEEAEWASKAGPVTTSKAEDDDESDEESNDG